MIKKFSDYDEIQVYDSELALEVGGYELTIKGARAEEFNNFSILKIAFDIINHDKYENFFDNKFKRSLSQNSNAKWPNAGIFDVFIPKDDGSEKDMLTKRLFKRFITSVEKSNSGFVWNWDEKTLVGKTFGGIFGREEFKNENGEYRFAVKCRFANSIEKIRSGNFTVPKDKLLPEHKNNAESPGNLSDYEEILNDSNGTVVPF